MRLHVGVGGFLVRKRDGCVRAVIGDLGIFGLWTHERGSCAHEIRLCTRSFWNLKYGFFPSFATTTNFLLRCTEYITPIPIYTLYFRIVARLFWFFLCLQLYFYSMLGVLKSICAPRMSNYSLRALITLRERPSAYVVIGAISISL